MKTVEDQVVNDLVAILILVIGLVVVVTFATGCASQGPPGTPGATGPSGAPGISPAAPAISIITATTAQCPNGGSVIVINTTDTVVCNGDTGPQGIVGPQGIPGTTGGLGPQGAPGTDITPITAVQFCPNVTPSYPSTFPETGLCIAGNMYGVYSENGGFLTYLPPGAYSSDGIDASCTFTIGTNCSISY